MFSTSATLEEQLGQRGLGEAIFHDSGQLDQVFIAREKQGRLVALRTMRGVPSHGLRPRPRLRRQADPRQPRPIGLDHDHALERRRPADVQARAEQGRPVTAEAPQQAHLARLDHRDPRPEISQRRHHDARRERSIAGAARRGRARPTAGTAGTPTATCSPARTNPYVCHRSKPSSRIAFNKTSSEPIW